MIHLFWKKQLTEWTFCHWLTVETFFCKSVLYDSLVDAFKSPAHIDPGQHSHLSVRRVWIWHLSLVCALVMDWQPDSVFSCLLLTAGMTFQPPPDPDEEKTCVNR